MKYKFIVIFYMYRKYNIEFFFILIGEHYTNSQKS